MKHLWFWILLSAAFVLTLWLWWSNISLQVTTYHISDSGIPSEFTGYRIVQISDLHNCQYGNNNKRLLKKISQAKPDIIVITGDMIDSRFTDTDIALSFAREAVKIAPVYYVPGNHEARLEVYPDFRQHLMDAGVVLLDHQAVTLEQGSSRITLLGIPDPSFSAIDISENEDIMESALNALPTVYGEYTVLLSHRPEFLDVYARHRVHLVLTGHAHGGQFRIPFLGGVFSPGQGFFPKYDAGVFRKDQTTMVISRGAGSKVWIPRVNNRPEIVVVELMHK